MNGAVNGAGRRLMSEPEPTRGLTTLERTRRENRRDLPKGLGSSIVTHSAVIVALLALVGLFRVPDYPIPQEQQRSQIITIETLVRDPQPAPHAGYEYNNLEVHIKKTPRLPVQGIIIAHRAGHHVTKPTVPKPSAMRELTQTAANAPPAATNGTTVVNQGSGIPDDNGDDGGGYLSPGHGSVWSEAPPSGPFGGGVGGHDSCTPSRGGFFLGHGR